MSAQGPQLTGFLPHWVMSVTDNRAVIWNITSL